MKKENKRDNYYGIATINYYGTCYTDLNYLLIDYANNNIIVNNANCLTIDSLKKDFPIIIKIDNNICHDLITGLELRYQKKNKNYTDLDYPLEISKVTKITALGVKEYLEQITPYHIEEYTNKLTEIYSISNHTISLLKKFKYNISEDNYIKSKKYIKNKIKK